MSRARTSGETGQMPRPLAMGQREPLGCVAPRSEVQTFEEEADILALGRGGGWVASG